MNFRTSDFHLRKNAALFTYLRQVRECIIEHATEEEKEWAAELMVHSAPWTKLGTTMAQARASCHHPEHQVYVAHLDKKPVGFIIFHPHGLAGSPYVKSICVVDAHRSAGIGAKMIEFGENLFKSKSRHMFLCVSSFNKRAHMLYEEMGYQQVGEFRDYIIEGESELLMHKRLK